MLLLAPAACSKVEYEIALNRAIPESSKWEAVDELCRQAHEKAVWALTPLTVREHLRKSGHDPEPVADHAYGFLYWRHGKVRLGTLHAYPGLHVLAGPVGGLPVSRKQLACQI